MDINFKGIELLVIMVWRRTPKDFQGRGRGNGQGEEVNFQTLMNIWVRSKEGVWGRDFGRSSKTPE